MFYLFIFMYMMALISLISVRKHLFLCLMSLEFIVISMMLMLLYFFSYYSTGFYIMVFCMVFFVCEGVLGLSILVSMIRCFGNDFLQSLSLW